MDVSIPEFVFALGVGAGLGLWFFGGLWWTVRQMPVARHPLLLAVGSFAVRTAGVVAGMIGLVGTRHWLLPLAALLGFVAVRQVMLSRCGRPRLEIPTR
jgi:F1F0 ATPase subunit 2